MGVALCAHFLPWRGDLMTQLPITFPDLVEILRACGPVLPEDCTPKRLRPIAVNQLTISEPRLAARVRQFDSDQLQALCDYVQAGLKLAAVPAG
jgi:hypothetical protein